MNLRYEVARASRLLMKQPGVADFELVGSAMFKDEPQDVDFAVMLKPGFNPLSWFPDLHGELSGWGPCGGEYGGQDQDHTWRAIREGNLNLLVTNDREWYDGCVLASMVVAALRLEKKSERVIVHRIVREGYSVEEARAAPMLEGVTD